MMLIRTSTETWNAEYTVQGNSCYCKNHGKPTLSRQNDYVLHIRAELRHSPPGNRKLE